VLLVHDELSEQAVGRKVRQRFRPDEEYLLAVQVNVDTPYMAEHGEVNKQWQQTS
jgi:ethanolamine ammonia-lyase small subunit